MLYKLSLKAVEPTNKTESWRIGVYKPGSKLQKKYYNTPFLEILNQVEFDNLFYNSPKFKIYLSKCTGTKPPLTTSQLSGKYITSQKEEFICDMTYGYYNMGNVGCEIIAVYNLLASIGKPQFLTTIIKEFDKNFMYYWLSIPKWGRFETDPDDLYKYFKAHKISYSKTKNIIVFASQLKSTSEGNFIIGYWTKGRLLGFIHTVYAHKNKNSNRLFVYNLSSKNKDGAEVASSRSVSNSEFLKIINSTGTFITSYKF